jgi:predicted anti-sigma-YlaC factor YlaD
MNHQPYHDWMFVDPGQPEEALTVEQAAALRAHLDECNACRELSFALGSLEENLRTAAQAAPAPGFASRWQARLAADRLRQRQVLHRRQSLVILAASLGIALAILTVLVYQARPFIQSPNLLVWVSVYQLIRWASIFSATGQFLGSLARAADISISPLSWLFAAGGLTLLAVLWVVSFRLLTQPKAIRIRNG